MKKALMTLLLTITVVLFLDPAKTLLSQFRVLENPIEHEIRHGEWLSKIAKEYYNDLSYWKELALVNRAPSGNRVFPGEKVMIPSFEAIKAIRLAQSLSDVNRLISEQQNTIADGPTVRQPTGLESTSELEAIATTDLSAPATSRPAFEEPLADVERPSKINYALMAGVIALTAIFVGGIFFYIRQRKAEVVEVYGHQSETIDDIETGRSVYLDGFEESDGRKNRRQHREVEPA